MHHIALKLCLYKKYFHLSTQDASNPQSLKTVTNTTVLQGQVS